MRKVSLHYNYSVYVLTMDLTRYHEGIARRYMWQTFFAQVTLHHDDNDNDDDDDDDDDDDNNNILKFYSVACIRMLTNYY